MMINLCFVFINQTGSSARKRSSVQNGFSPNDSVKITAETTAKSDSPTTKPAVLRKLCFRFYFSLLFLGSIIQFHAVLF